MHTPHHHEQAAGVLQELGLKEYEAKAFVGLTRVATATAKELGGITDVPRTRVYDAIRVLAHGLVETQHSKPQRFRAVPLSEAVATLRGQFESRIGTYDETSVDGDPAIGRMLLVDRETILVSSVEHHNHAEQAIFGTGFGNGLVIIARRLLATGLLPGDDPGTG